MTEIRLAFICMQKNEEGLLRVWLAYHLRLAPAKSIFVYDNGSSSELTIEILAKAERDGVNVVRKYSSNTDYQRKHIIIQDNINALISSKKYNFIIPLDCDEFFSVETNEGELYFDESTVYYELERYKDSVGPFKAKGSYYNIPGDSGSFFFYKERTVFFSCHEPVIRLDHGYHEAQVQNSSEPVETSVVILHFQFKRFEVAKTQAANKLKSRVENFSSSVIGAYNGAGSHMVRFFTMNPKQYEKQYRKAGLIQASGFFESLRAVNTPFPEDMYFSTDRYAESRSSVLHNTYLEATLGEGFVIEDCLFVLRYSKNISHLVVYGESSLALLLLTSGVDRLTVVGLDREKLTGILGDSRSDALREDHRLSVIHADIGEADEFGHPDKSSGPETTSAYVVDAIERVSNQSPSEIVVICGRFRVAVALKALSLAPPGCQFFILNFWSRASYHALLPFFEIVDTEGDSVLLRRAHGFNPAKFDKLLALAKTDPL